MNTTVREFTGGAKRTALTADVTSGALSFTVTDGTGYPTGALGPFVVLLDHEQAGEEKVLCTSRSGNTFTVTSRGFDGTAASAHSATATVDHVLDATTLQEVITFLNSASLNATLDAVDDDGKITVPQGSSAVKLGGNALGGAIGGFVNSIKITVDGTTYKIPFYG